MSQYTDAPSPLFIFYVQWTLKIGGNLKFGSKIRKMISKCTCVPIFKLIGRQLHPKLPRPKTLTDGRTEGRIDGRTNERTDGRTDQKTKCPSTGHKIHMNNGGCWICETQTK